MNPVDERDEVLNQPRQSGVGALDDRVVVPDPDLPDAAQERCAERLDEALKLLEWKEMVKLGGAPALMVVPFAGLAENLKAVLPETLVMPVDGECSRPKGCCYPAHQGWRLGGLAHAPSAG